jgi:hypothetical protein
MPKIIVGELKLGESLQEHIVSDSSSVRICDDSRRTAYIIRLMPDGKTLEITAGEPFADAAGNICGRTLAVVPAEPTRVFLRAEKYGEDGRGRTVEVGRGRAVEVGRGRAVEVGGGWAPMVDIGGGWKKSVHPNASNREQVVFDHWGREPSGDVDPLKSALLGEDE